MTAVYPDGREEILLNVPKYDLNRQTVYEYQQSKTLPGSKLVWSFSSDNSRRNAANPDPTKPVRWGDQTFEEMGIAFVRFRYLDETTSKPAHAACREAGRTQRLNFGVALRTSCPAPLRLASNSYKAAQCGAFNLRAYFWCCRNTYELVVAIWRTRRHRR